MSAEFCRQCGQLVTGWTIEADGFWMDYSNSIGGQRGVTQYKMTNEPCGHYFYGVHDPGIGVRHR